MKTLIISSILLLSVGSVTADDSISRNQDLYSGYGAHLVSNVNSNFNDNPDLYGNGYGEDSLNESISSVDQIDFNDVTANTSNQDAYGGI